MSIAADMAIMNFSFLAGIEEGTKDKLLIPEQGE